jgi:hypothetical protein
MSLNTVAIVCWIGLMAYTLGSLYLALFKGLIYVVPGRRRIGPVRRVKASDYPKEHHAQLVALGFMLGALVIGGLTMLFGCEPSN